MGFAAKKRFLHFLFGAGDVAHSETLGRDGAGQMPVWRSWKKSPKLVSNVKLIGHVELSADLKSERRHSIRNPALRHPFDSHQKATFKSTHRSQPSSFFDHDLFSQGHNLRSCFFSNSASRLDAWISPVLD